MLRKLVSRPWITLALLFLISYFMLSARDGLHAYFTQDDGGNLIEGHQCWKTSVLQQLGYVLCTFTPAFRPLGGLYYIIVYRLAGFNPLAFRAICLSLVLLNVILTFAVIRAFSGSTQAAFLGAMLLAYHPALLWLFYSSGTIYEILCFLF